MSQPDPSLLRKNFNRLNDNYEQKDKKLENSNDKRYKNY
jgi:hypothetical protein